MLPADAQEYRRWLGRDCDIDHPRAHSEFVTRKKYTDRSALLTKTADKIACRDWVAEQGLSEILTPAFVTRDIDEAVANITPSCFVKMNNASGRNLRVETVRGNERQQLEAWWSLPYGEDKGEWCYQDIEPGVVIEPILLPPIHVVWRLLCWYGVPRYIEAHEYEYNKTLTHTMYTLPDYAPVDVVINDRDRRDVARPVELERMLEIARVLSRPFDFVRVDLFGSVYFSELTHYPRSGRYKYTPDSFDFELGKEWR